MAKRGVSVGVEITGSAKGYKSAADDAKKATDELKRNAAKNNREIQQNFKMAAIAVAKVGAAVLTAQKAWQVYSKVMQSTQLTGDALDITLAGIKGTATALAQNLALADFSVSLKDAKKAAEDFQAILDDLGDRANSIDIISAKNNAEIARLRGQLRDTTLSEEKRLKITARIQEIGAEELKDRKALATEALGGITEKAQTKYKIDLASAELLTRFVEEYKLFDKAQQDALVNAQLAQKKLDTWLQNNSENISKGIYSFAKLEKLQSDVAAAAGLVPEALRQYIPLWREISDLNDEERKQIKDIIVQWYNANAAIETYLATADRYENKLTNKTRKPVAISKIGSMNVPGMNAGLPSLPGLQGTNNKGAIIETTDALASQMEMVQRLESTFANLFINVSGGFKSMIKSFIDSLRILVAELLAKASAFMILKFLFPEAFIALDLFKVGGFKKFIGLADGGIVSKPTMAMIGEGSEPEVVAPLSKLQSITGNMQHIKLDVTGKITGRDIYLSATKYAEVLQNNT